MMTSIERLITNTNKPKDAVKIASLGFDEQNARKVSAGLTKVASYPYRESSYNAVCGIMKIAANIIDETIDSYSMANDRAEELEKNSSIRGIVDGMIDGGFIGRYDAVEKIAELSVKSSNELEVVKEAMSLASNDTGSGLFERDKVASIAGPKKKAGMFDGVLR